MHHVSSRADGRGSISTYQQQESEEDGMLRPSARENTQSRWGSVSTGLESRRDSVFYGIDKDIRLGSIKRPEEIHSMDDLQRVRDLRSRGEQYLRSALSAVGTLATDITRRLDYTYYGLLEKIAALTMTIVSLQELSDTTSKLFDDFQQETTGLEHDIRKQIGDLHEFQPQVQRIEALEERMRASKTRAKALSNRLDAMRSEIERWDKREMEWQMRTNQRLRIFWGIITSVILAALVFIILQHWPSEETSSGFKALPRSLKLTNNPSHIPHPKENDAFSPSSRSEYAMTLESSNLDGTTSTVQKDPSTSVGADKATRSADYDPLRIFDEL
ncbi:hypothetical protein AN8882.2 [Aspergillus nidulans FGSC A4]|nr:hypothetical protein AN8882.2 [Aspergillus nidulans FGSC A4]|eukprot:XP_682151.1 hypothetical protein AN8882.2 [Aspergillus nidulans FGSC A4]